MIWIGKFFLHLITGGLANVIMSAIKAHAKVKQDLAQDLITADVAHARVTAIALQSQHFVVYAAYVVAVWIINGCLLVGVLLPVVIRFMQGQYGLTPAEINIVLLVLGLNGANAVARVWKG